MNAQQKSFDTSEWYDYIFGFVVAGFLSTVAAILVSLIGSIGFFGWFLVFLAAPVAGNVIAEGARIVIRRHRSRSLFLTIAAGAVVGSIPVLIFQILSMNIFGIVFQVIYLVVAVPLVYTRLSGIQFFK